MEIMPNRLVMGLALACLLGALTGCVTDPARATAKPSYATFQIDFQPTDSARPTGMIITPNDGDVFLQVVKSPSHDDNKVIWRSSQNFRVKFVQVDDQTQPLKPGRELGDEKKDWNEATKKHGAWEYTLNLKQGSGSARETVAAKYFVEHYDSKAVFDPVIIVNR